MAFLRQQEKARQGAIKAGTPVISQQQIDVAAARERQQLAQTYGGVVARQDPEEALKALGTVGEIQDEGEAKTRALLTAQNPAAAQARLSEAMSLAERQKDRKRETALALVEQARMAGSSASDSPFATAAKAVAGGVA